jgi:hypothetical protein
MKTAQDISVGRIVHYTPADRPHLTNAAMVAAVKDPIKGIVNLHIFPSGTSYVVSDVAYSETQYPNTWRWPRTIKPEKPEEVR